MDAVTADLKIYEAREETREAAYDEAEKNRQRIVAFDLEVRESGDLEQLMAEVAYHAAPALTGLVAACHKSLHYEVNKENLIRAALDLVREMEGQADKMWGDDLVERSRANDSRERRPPPRGRTPISSSEVYDSSRNTSRSRVRQSSPIWSLANVSRWPGSSGRLH